MRIDRPDRGAAPTPMPLRPAPLPTPETNVQPRDTAQVDAGTGRLDRVRAAVAAAGDVRSSRVAAIKAALTEGSYAVDLDALAKSLRNPS